MLDINFLAYILVAEVDKKTFKNINHEYLGEDWQSGNAISC